MKKRMVKDRLMQGLSWLLTALTFVPLIGVLWLVAVHAIPALSLKLFITSTSGVAGGLANAILGTVLIVALALLIATPLGILGGVYLSEYGQQNQFGLFVRLAADVLSGVPSIVLGYFGFVTMVIGLGWGFSWLAAAITLAIMSLPYIIRNTEVALAKVPRDLREASYALGAGEMTTTFRITLSSARAGVLTGVLLALSISLGETAPLIYTAGWSSYLPTLNLTHASIGYLTYVVWSFISEPYASAHALAYAAALVLLVFILAINIVARRLSRRLDPTMRRG